MNSLENAGHGMPVERRPLASRLLPLFAGLASIWLAYVIGSWDGRWTGMAVAAISISFAAICLRVSAKRSSEHDRQQIIGRTPTGREFEEKLIALDEANELFGGSLNAADMFRLVSSRIGEIFPFAASALVMPDETGKILRFVHVDGVGAEAIRDFEIDISDGLAGAAFASGAIEVENGLGRDIRCLGVPRTSEFVSSAAVPLIYGEETFAVLQLFTSEPIDETENTIEVLQAISDHVTPVFRNSLAFERSISGALTDALTGLPNERAFRMVLENQLAESVRHRDERPLTILSFDIRDFGAVNSMLGHAVGDRMLEFTGSCIGESLRKMDFLARTTNDEFNVILPTASEDVAFEVVERIKESFSHNEFEIAGGEGVVIALNVGWATFWKDGETPDQLIRAAQQRKRQAKSETPSGVLWFPREYVH